ncbi:MAG: thiamine phosphate synthase [Deltaproteobacteria bacterium]|jgi:thiamine-phosphate pyrophosphorylase|nr:thiamine phosphate synthase [Deltaproteobacteria bacterium]
MTTFVSDPRLVLVTDRHLAKEPLPELIKTVTSAGVGQVILREKELSPEEFLTLAREVQLALGKKARLFLNGRQSLEAAVYSGACGCHLPWDEYLGCNGLKRHKLKVGVSVHSFEQALEVEREGADYVLFGPIFPTTCKPGHPGTGLENLADICQALSIPVWAVGGLTPNNLRSVMETGASAVCLRSALMLASRPGDLVKASLEALKGFPLEATKPLGAVH